MDFSLDEAADLIDAVHVGIEVASSPLGSINEIGPIAVISDFGNNNGMVIGPEIRGLARQRFRAMGGRPRRSTAQWSGPGRAAAFPDGAIGAARFLFELMARRGDRAAAGPVDLVRRGDRRPCRPPGQRVEARFRDGLSVSCTLVAARPE